MAINIVTFEISHYIEYTCSSNTCWHFTNRKTVALVLISASNREKQIRKFKWSVNILILFHLFAFPWILWRRCFCTQLEFPLSSYDIHTWDHWQVWIPLQTRWTQCLSPRNENVSYVIQTIKFMYLDSKSWLSI